MGQAGYITTVQYGQWFLKYHAPWRNSMSTNTYNLKKTLQSGEWKNHPEYPGVRIRQALSSDQSDGVFRALFVLVDPGKALLPHVHEHETEIHLVLDGEGSATIGNSSSGNRHIAYIPGSVEKIQANTRHGVKAGAGGLLLYAQFVQSP